VRTPEGPTVPSVISVPSTHPIFIPYIE